MIAWILCAVAMADPLALSYQDALDRAIERNPSLANAEEDLRSAEGALLAARGTFDPSLTGDVGYSSSTSEGTREFGTVSSEYQGLSANVGLSEYFATGTSVSLDYSATRSKFLYTLTDIGQTVESDAQFESRLGLSVSQSILQGHRVAYNLQGVRKAKRSRDAAELGRSAERQQTLADVASAYWGLYYAQRQETLAEQAVAVAQEEQRVVNARVEAGDLAPVERSRVAAAVVQAESALISARNGAASAADGLLLLLGLDPGVTVSLLTAPSEPSPMTLDADAVVEGALSNNPSLAVLRLTEENAALSLSDARHARLPELTATGSYALNGYDVSAGQATSEMFSGALPVWYLGANVSVPLGNRADRGAYLSAGASAAQARIDRETAERSVSQQVRAQVRTLESAYASVQLADANLRLAEETLAAERALQEVGRAIQKDVLEAIKTVDDARLAAAKARSDYQVAVVELEQLKGTL